MYDTLRIENDGAIRTIFLNRSDKLNALNDQMIDDLLDAFDKADEDDEVRAVIVTGEGRAFCAGMEFQEGENAFEVADGAEEFRDIGGKVTLRIYDMKKPVIAAINGSAVGFGITVTLPMDYRVVAEKAKIGFVFSKRGIVPESVSSWFLPRIVGVSKALEWFYEGNIFLAREGYEAKLFQSIVPSEDVLTEAKAVANRFIDNTSPVSVGLSRKLVWEMMGATNPLDAHLLESKLLHWAGNNKDSQEGVAAFLEEREPEFPLKVSKDFPDYFS